jgi:hypothetical protein
MRQSASGAQATARTPSSLPATFLHSSSFLVFIFTLVLVPSTFQVAAAPSFLPLFARSSSFANRMQAEANAVNLTCRLLLPKLGPARRVAGVVFSDISGGAGYFLRQFCSFEAERSREFDVKTLSFGSLTALRTSLMLRRLAPPRSSVNSLSHSSEMIGTLVRVGSCCQSSSDIEELSFPSPCFGCSAVHSSVSSTHSLIHVSHPLCSVHRPSSAASK